MKHIVVTISTCPECKNGEIRKERSLESAWGEIADVLSDHSAKSLYNDLMMLTAGPKYPASSHPSMSEVMLLVDALINRWPALGD